MTDKVVGVWAIHLVGRLFIHLCVFIDGSAIRSVSQSTINHMPSRRLLFELSIPSSSAADKKVIMSLSRRQTHRESVICLAVRRFGIWAKLSITTVYPITTQFFN